MHDLLVKILKTAIFLISWSNGTSKDSATQDFPPVNATTDLTTRLLNLIAGGHYVDKREIRDVQPARRYDSFGRHTENSLIDRSHDSRSYYGVPAPPYVPAFDPISVLASLAFLAFLLQSFAALFDRTRSIIPTIISSRRSSSEYGERFAETEKRVLRALEEYASLSNNLLDDEKENEKSNS